MTHGPEFPMVVNTDCAGLIRFDDQGTCIYCSSGASQLLGVTDLPVGAKLRDLLLPSCVMQLMDACLTDYRAGDRLTVRAMNGQPEVSDVPFIAFGLLGLEGIELVVLKRPENADVTGSPAASEQGTLAALAAGVAHEVRNPLTAVKGFLQLLLEQHEPRYVDVALREVDRAVRILNGLLSITRPGDADERLIEVELCSLADEVLLLFEDQFYSIEAVRLYEEPHVRIYARPEQLKKALFNLIKNAIEAMQGSGQLTLEQKYDGDHISFSVRDTGPGIDPAILKRLGTPFVSDKAGGTGIGVALVKSTMRDLRGSMSVDSSSRGTTFTLLFPRSGASGRASAKSSEPQRAGSLKEFRREAAVAVEYKPISQSPNRQADRPGDEPGNGTATSVDPFVPCSQLAPTTWLVTIPPLVQKIDSIACVVRIMCSIRASGEMAVGSVLVDVSQSGSANGTVDLAREILAALRADGMRTILITADPLNWLDERTEDGAVTVYSSIPEALAEIG